MAVQVNYRIRRLTAEIREATQVTKRRQLSAELRNVLSDQRNREMLLREATTKKALCHIWATILQAALFVAEKSSTGKKKYHKEDVSFPYYMLVQLTEFARFANADSLLPSKDVQELVHYCVGLLSVKDAMDKAGAELMNMLELMCSRPDFVAHFRSHTEMQKILSELQERLARPDKPTLFEISAKAFASLLGTAKSIGIGMHLLMPSCLSIIETWSRSRLDVIHESRSKDITGLEYMFKAAVAILTSHPEHAVFELSRSRSILKLAKYCYVKATSKKNKEALIEYFLAHLLVCQTAGKLQGLLPGDLGDVGRTSLEAREINKLIEMVVTETDIDKVRMGNDVTKSHTKARTPNREPSLEPTDLSRLHFELCARLLACSQRQYLSAKEWSVVDSPNDYLAVVPDDPHPETPFTSPHTSEAFKSCSQSDFLQSPWMTSVGIPLWSYCDNVLSREASQLDPGGSQGTSISTSSPVSAPQSDMKYFASILHDMSDKMYDQASKSPVPFLQLVCACAETFPLGQCWTSNTQRNWQTHTPSDLLSEDPAYCNGCSTDDIALVVSLVTNILDAFGGPNGNQQTQRWALTCLIRLTESSALVSLASEQKGVSSPILHVVWQRVWTTLFRTDLRYASYTRNASGDSLGELVLVLLTEIVQRRCTDPPMSREGISLPQSSIGDFVHANQSKIWNLDAFSDADSVAVQAVFDLTIAVLRFAGLSEEDRDVIDGSGPNLAHADSRILDRVPTSSRRYRLLALCLRYLERKSPMLVAGDEDDITETACACLLSLVTGKSTPALSTFEKLASIEFRGALRQYFCVTNIPVDRRDRRSRDSQAATFSSFFQCLWNDEFDKLPKSWLPYVDLPLIEFDNSELTISRELLGMGRQLLGDRHCDFVSTATASILHQFVTDILMKRSASSNDSSDDDYEFDESAMRDQVPGVTVASMLSRISVLKLLMAVAFSSSDHEGFKQADMELVEGRVNTLLDEIVENFPTTEQDDKSCVTLVTNLLQVLQALSVVALSIDDVFIPETISTRLESVFSMCRRMIREYSQSRALGASIEPNERQGRDTVSFDDDEDEEPETDRQRKTIEFGSDSDVGDDSDDDFLVSGHKRRRSTDSWSRKKRRRSKGSANEDPCKSPTSLCVKRLASIVVLLQPTYGVCRMVADSIAMFRTGRESCDLDMDASLHCLNLFCSPLVIHRSQSLDTDSVLDELPDPDAEVFPSGSIVSLCNDLVQGIRTSAGPGSIYCLFGFEVCADLVHQRENKGCTHIDGSERYNVVEMLLLEAEGDERKSLKRRPNLKARQFAAFTSVFRDGQKRLHDTLDTHYKSFISPGLGDVSAPLRKQTARAVGAALRAFANQDNIVKGVNKKFPPLLTQKNTSADEQFAEWWEQRGPGVVSESSAAEETCKGALHSFQSTTIETKGFIAGTTKHELFRDCLFEFVLLASERPDLEALCYSACAQTAGLTEFGTVQHLLMSEEEYICDKWIDTGRSLKELPLLLSAPTVLFQLLKCGMAQFLIGAGAIEFSSKRTEELRNDERTVEMTALRECAAQEYVERSACFLVPIICMKDPGQSEKYLEEMKDIFKEDDGDDGTRKLLSGYFHYILAFVEPFLHDGETTSNRGKAVVSYLTKLFTKPKYDTLRQKGARRAVHQLLNHWGKNSEDFEARNLSKEVVQEAIIALSQEGTGKRKDPFAVVGSSVTECVLHARFWLSRSLLTRQKESRWSAIEQVFSIVLVYIKGGGDQLELYTQLGFCIHTIVDILADPALSPIHPTVLGSLNNFLCAVLNLGCDVSSEISPVFYRLVGTLVAIHERCQNELIEKCLSSWLKQRRLLHRSSGLRLSAKSSRNDSGDVWGWDRESVHSRKERIETILVTERSEIDDRLFKTLTGSYVALEHLFNNTDTLRGKAAVPIECLAKFASQIEAYKPLSQRDQKLCARSMVESFLKTELAGTQPLRKYVSTFLDVSETLLASQVDGRPQRHAIHEATQAVERDREASLSVDSRLLLDELNHVREAMERSAGSPLEFGAHAELTREERYSLINLLLKLCEASYPEGIRAAASRCLGAVGPSDVENLASAELELSGNGSAELFQASEKDQDLLSMIKGSCLKLLCQYLLSPRPETAIAAVEAAKAILVSGDEKYQELVGEDNWSLLVPLKPAKERSKPSLADFAVPRGYLDSMLRKATAGDVALSTDEDPSWCWHQALWTSDRNGSLSYEDWIKFISCAMITCCFLGDSEIEQGTQQVRGSGMFFRYCVKLCALEHEFASKAFPGIVLDLLLNDKMDSGSIAAARQSSRANTGHSESEACKHLSRCFSTLIDVTDGKETGELAKQSQPTQSLSLAVETIDMMRYIIQTRFEKSKHKRNSSTIGKSERAPNGIGLRLNGLSVSRACMRANRFASALFYADMHSEMCYGSAARVLERLSNGELTTVEKEVDISGFGESDGTDPGSDGTVDGNLSLPSILYHSFAALHDRDAAGAVDLDSAAMSFLNDGFKWNVSNTLQYDTLERLKALDLQCQDQNGRIVAGQRVLECMQDIGLEGVLQTYTAGLVNQSGASPSSLSAVEQANLRDQYFRGRLKLMQWDGELFSGSTTQEPSQSPVGVSGPVVYGIGFHEGLSKALSSFMNDDMVAFQQVLSQARSCLVDNLSQGREGEAPLRGLIGTVERLQFLNDVENLSDGDSCKTLAKVWQAQNEKALGGNVVEFPVTKAAQPLRLSESVTWVREVMLRAFQAKHSVSGGDLSDCLLSHLWQIGSIARLVGRSDYADSSVQRLHVALQLKHTGGLDKQSLLRMRFEEAMIMESRGEFSSAIRGVKLLSSHVESLKSRDGMLEPWSEALYADTLLACGEWVNRYKIEPGAAIMKNYLSPATKLADKIRAREGNAHNTHRSFAAHLALAKLTSGLFESVSKIVESLEWARAGDNITLKRNELEGLIAMKDDALKAYHGTHKTKKRKKASGKTASSSSEAHKLKFYEANIPQREKELKNMEDERETTEGSILRYLRLALESYCEALVHASIGESSDISTHVYSLISLWFGNYDKRDRAEPVNEVMSRTIEGIPSFRFVPLAYQIFSRIASGTEKFQSILNKLVRRMCTEHPYHCLVQLMALSNGEETGTGLGANEYRENVDVGKVECAKQIIDRLQNGSSSRVRGLVKSYGDIVEAYSHLALASTEGLDKRAATREGVSLAKASTRELKLEKVLGERHIDAYDFPPCIFTKSPALNPGGHYGDGKTEAPAGSELIKRFDLKWTYSTTGISRPKFIFCFGASGERYKQVVKGNDDCRGDAVMQQVFCYVNDLMKRRSDSSKSMGSAQAFSSVGAGNLRVLKDQLNIVTYHIVPLSPATGVLEFVKDTISLGAYLNGGGRDVGAHSRYNPGELGYGDAHAQLKECSEASADERRQEYDKICLNFTPVFRYFFTEKFGHSLPLWYAAKTKYTQSCAVNSIVGHMLGIGDRHLHNILIQETTGAVVHIDFGIVFEQGKLLQTPETVPFRLTRDVVDGMGPCGTEGTFSRTAEETATVLRENADGLLTILSAVVSDPLFKWNLTPGEARERQRAHSEEGDGTTKLENEVTTGGGEADNVMVTDNQANEAGIRAIARIQEKLQGYEDGTSGERQSVEGQVKLLINSARSDENLGKLYFGWSAFV